MISLIISELLKVHLRSFMGICPRAPQLSYTFLRIRNENEVVLTQSTA